MLLGTVVIWTAMFPLSSYMMNMPVAGEPNRIFARVTHSEARFGDRKVIKEDFGAHFARKRSNNEIVSHSDTLKSAATDCIKRFTGISVMEATRKDQTVKVRTLVEGKARTFEASELLLATGRTPNTSELGLEETGVQVGTEGFLQVDETLQTSVEGIYGAGDVIGTPMYVNTAAYEGALAAENALSEGKRKGDYRALPWVIFTDPQVCGVGLDEARAKSEGIDFESVKLPLTQVPRALVGHDTEGFIKLIRDRRSDRLVGARILAREGSELLMEISLAIKYGIPVKELAGAFHPYLTLSEAVKLAALSFEKDVKKLSCCAA